jgi:hypothetical protein
MSRQYNISPAVTDNEESALFYHARTATFTINKPNVILHAGAAPNEYGKINDSDPVVAVCYMPTLTHSFKIGLGDSEAAVVQWEDMKAPTPFRNGYHWEIHDAESGSGRKRLVWKRTKSVKVDGEGGQGKGRQGWKLMDAEATQDDKVLAVFTGGTIRDKWTDVGTLQLDVGCGRDFEVIVVMTFLAVWIHDIRAN